MRYTYRQRIRSLRSTSAAAEKLLSAIRDGSHHFCYFPDLGVPQRPYLPDLEVELCQFKQTADALAEATEKYISEKGSASKPWIDLKYSLVWELLKIYEDIPDQDGEKRRATRINERGHRPRGPFVDFVREVARPVLGRHETLDEEIRIAIYKKREYEKSTSTERK
jgi:hypothetical protein